MRWVDKLGKGVFEARAEVEAEARVISRVRPFPRKCQTAAYQRYLGRNQNMEKI